MSELDFVPSEELKRLQSIEMDLFNQFKRVCDENNLRYYAIGGTLLGAARHKGFIPWDDDMDFGMLWEDFVIFCDIAAKSFREPYFLQCYSSDLYAKPEQARLRRSDTTGCTLWEYNNVYDASCNRGIFIDIFPLFNVPETEEDMVLYRKHVVDIWKAVRGFIAADGSKHGCDTYDKDYNDYVEDYERYSKKYTIEQIRQLYLERCAMFNGRNTEKIGLMSLRTNNPRWQWDREWFADTVKLPFENTTIFCPKMFNEILTCMYGEWQVPVRGTALHEMFVVDTNVPYYENKKLINKLSNKV